MIFRQLKRLLEVTYKTNVREYSYKPIKRPDFNSVRSKAFVENKMKEYNLAQILRARIELSGPITGAYEIRKEM